MVEGKVKGRRSAPKTGGLAHSAFDERYRRVFDHSPIGLVHIDSDGNIVDCNEVYCRIMGASREDIVGLNLIAILKDEAMIAAVNRALAGKTGVFEGDYVSVVAGKRSFIKALFSKVSSGSGKDLELVGIIEDVAERKLAEAEISKRTYELGERVKELKCLYSISKIGQEPGASLDEMLWRAVDLIPPAWQFPDIACARISAGSNTYATSNFLETRWILNCDIVSKGVMYGRIDVCYLSEKPPSDEGPFLIEERFLINAVAERLATIIENKLAESRIFKYQRQLKHLASELSLTEERERRRMATALHDQISNVLAIAKIRLGEVAETTPSGELADALGLIEKAIHASRWLTIELSPPVLYELCFDAALGWLVRQVRDSYGIQAEFQDDGWPKPLGEDTRVILFRAVQELLVNAAKHANAASVKVVARRAGGKIQIDVEDNGVGFDTLEHALQQGVTTGFGLFSIQERLSHIGGSMEIESEPGLGTKITLTVPAEKEDTHKEDGAKKEQAAIQETSARKIRILIADDQKIIREGLSALLGRQDDMEVVGEAAEGRSAVALALELHPHVVVMDVSMPDMNGIEATKKILSECPDVKVIALSMYADSQYVSEMLRAGAAGYLLKDCAQEDLAQAIRMVNANLTFLSPGIAETVVGNYMQKQATSEVANRAADDLTPREREVLALLAEGRNTKQIALLLGVSVKTIEAHRQHIMEKLDLHTMADLTKYALRQGLISLDS